MDAVYENSAIEANYSTIESGNISKDEDVYDQLDTTATSAVQQAINGNTKRPWRIAGFIGIVLICVAVASSITGTVVYMTISNKACNEDLYISSDIDECASTPCMNGATCTNGQNKFTCTCTAGWTGTTCSADIDECASNPCMNGATCTNGQNKFTCTCTAGWTGTTCSADIDECASTPCMNGATCTNGQNKFTCTCTAGWTGTTCSADIDECASNPCMNGATCSNSQNKFTCTCTAGWTGTTCSADIDECASNPCINGATCTNGQNKFTCTCTAGWSGTTCSAGKVSSTDCYDVLHLGVGNISGVYTVKMPQSHDLVNVYCDMTTDGGGWTVFQYRFDGSVEFYESFARYETGFGDVHGEFWLGLKFIYEMTHQTKSEIYLNFVDSNGNIAMERFSDFYISAGSDYTLHVGELLQQNDSTSFDSLMKNNGSRFSAKDVDHDGYRHHCAQGWWYRICSLINPNGDYGTPGQQSSYHGGLGGMINYGWRRTKSLKSTKLMFRRI